MPLSYFFIFYQFLPVTNFSTGTSLIFLEIIIEIKNDQKDPSGLLFLKIFFEHIVRTDACIQVVD